MYGSPHKGPPGYYMLDSRYAHRAYFPQEYAEQRYPAMGGFIPAPYHPHPNSHHPYMPWTPHDHIPAVFVQQHPDFHPQVPVNEQPGAHNRAESVASSSDSSGNSSKKSAGKGRKSPQVHHQKYTPIKHKSAMQLAEIEEMAQQADRMRINDKSSSASRGRRNSGESGGSSNDSGHGGQYNEEGDYEIPTDDQVEKIIDQVEYYLSDEYLAKDKYLLRQIRCKSEGYISIKDRITKTTTCIISSWRENRSEKRRFENGMRHRLYNVTAYASVLSDPFSVQEHMIQERNIGICWW